MKSLTEIRQELSSVMRQAEDFREEKLSAFNKGLMYTFITLGIGLVLLFLGIPNNTLLIVLGAIAALGSIGVYYWTAGKHSREFQAHFKSMVTKKVVESMYPSVSYSPEHFINQSDFNSSMLFSTNANRYKGEDYFSGNINNASFQMSELTVQHHRRRTSGSNTSSSTETIFRGFFVIMQLEKNSYGETYIFPDTAEKLFGSFGKMLQRSIGSFFQRGSMIYLEEYPDFEKQFVVYSTEEIESRRLLAPGLLKAIAELHEKWKVRPRLAFIGNKVYVALHQQRNMFKVSLKKSLVDERQQLLQSIFEETALCMSIVESISKEALKV